MKEIYIAPEVELLCLVPAEAVAVSPASFDNYIGNEIPDIGNISHVIVNPDEDVEIII